MPVPTASDRVPAPSAPARDPDGRARIVEAATLPADTAPVRAALHPGTLVIVRDDSTVQVGIAPDRAVMVTAPRSCGPHRLAALLEDLVGGADLGAAAARAGIAEGDLPGVAGILVRLTELGHVNVASPATTARSRAGATPRPAPVRRVHMVGAGQVSRILRGPLSVNGCRVSVSPTPGLALDPDRPPWHRRGPAPDLVLLTGTVAVDPVITVALARAAQPHLHVHCRDGRVVVGPMVVPGLTPCLRCADLYRADRDPRSPYVAAQLIDRSSHADTPALTAAAALVLAEIAATRDPVRPLQTVGATIEINPAEGLWRRRDWPADERCTCGAATPSAPLP